MNQQIQKLAQQAGMYVDVKGEPWPRWMGAEECEAAYARFAELIVQECIQVLNPDDIFEIFTRKMAQDTIKQHFGVEE
jgi:hypothetical protein